MCADIAFSYFHVQVEGKMCREKLHIWGTGDQNLGCEQYIRDQWSLKGCHIPGDYLDVHHYKGLRLDTQFKTCIWVKIT
jgi:hypothetical protein